jgi:hypothetical protein
MLDLFGASAVRLFSVAAALYVAATVGEYTLSVLEGVSAAVGGAL